MNIKAKTICPEDLHVLCKNNESRKGNRMKRIMFLITILILMSASFVFSSGNQENLLFKDNEIGFSFEYPKNFVPEPFQNPSEVARFVSPNQYKLPAIVATVYDKMEHATSTEIAFNFIKRMQRKIPGASGFQITEDKIVTLDSGLSAYLSTIVWKWVDGTTIMETVSIAGFTEDKMITLTFTSASGLHKLDEAINLCMTLNITL